MGQLDVGVIGVGLTRDNQIGVLDVQRHDGIRCTAGVTPLGLDRSAGGCVREMPGQFIANRVLPMLPLQHGPSVRAVEGVPLDAARLIPVDRVKFRSARTRLSDQNKALRPMPDYRPGSRAAVLYPERSH
ncbi:hypothetical protein GCT13_39670 [Paraburkholderia sp. CNPSo 3157]|uniref:Uncharacterized protein n=1 Tax=Paraburkholderia franconis TaxID=2654983 RepID=A0A7X1NJQ2_9BURK|nr:hypothetical protein [Paraburkholderia franconis]MPW22763.1 hypothetical protein [Paraburkholderia franconis]